ncbi:MAG: hypothetical protein LBD68_03085 [Zoogloeaceae bacterium]|jgi:toxin CptA|nr:hypothetical protein [Zoogloeaceae bacterium]
MRFPIVIELRPSRLLLRALFILHALAALGVCLAGWSATLFWVAPGALLFLLLSGIHAVARHWRLQTRTLWLYADGTIGLARAERPQPLLASPRPGILALPWICVFSWRLMDDVLADDTPRSGTLTLLPDSADADALRRLRLWLKREAESRAAIR